jgi:hypothetical protein
MVAVVSTCERLSMVIGVVIGADRGLPRAARRWSWCQPGSYLPAQRHHLVQVGASDIEALEPRHGRREVWDASSCTSGW